MAPFRRPAGEPDGRQLYGMPHSMSEPKIQRRGHWNDSTVVRRADGSRQRAPVPSRLASLPERRTVAPPVGTSPAALRRRSPELEPMKRLPTAAALRSGRATSAPTFNSVFALIEKQNELLTQALSRMDNMEARLNQIEVR